jgi:hypothetical protein
MKIFTSTRTAIMTNDVQVDTIRQSSVPETLPVEEVLEAIRRDSQQDPQQYLDETIVKYGGE